MKRVSIFILLIIASASVYSQYKKWSLNDCFDYTMSRNLTIQDAKLRETGGIIGVVLGVLITNLLAVILNWPTKITSYSVGLSFFACTITGVFLAGILHKK